MKKIFLTLLFLIFVSMDCSAATVWINDARAQFQSNNLVILGVNIRTFNAKDYNRDGIIDTRKGEERGNFINAIDRLDELALQGVNTIHLYPITPVSKVKAKGTAGSLYALTAFDNVNPQLASKKSRLTPKEQAKRFIDEAHRRKIHVLIDLPAFVSYEYYLKYNGRVVTKGNGLPLIYADYSDVRIPDVGKKGRLNLDVVDQYKAFVDMAIDLGCDGIVANTPYIKPIDFWQTLISYAREKSPQFLFIAQSSDKEVQQYKLLPFTPYNELLLAGFDGYYAGYSRFSDWRTSQDLYSHVLFNKKLFSKYDLIKSDIGSFATLEQVSPMLVNGSQYSIMIAWLNATLPVNAYFVDGFQSGDDYSFPLENKKAKKSFTDDNFYFVNRGKMDIFNFSRKPGTSNGEILQNFVLANKFKYMMSQILPNANFVPLQTNDQKVFAYARSVKNNSVIVIGNIDFEKMVNVKVTVPHLNQRVSVTPIKIQDIPEIKNNKINTILAPGEIQVLLAKDFSIK